ncbi:MAG: BrnA antitoxin family protein [Phreatobacter sp.]
MPMTGKEPVSKSTWVDPDDAPEWTDEMFESADLYHGETLIRRGRPRKARSKVPVSIRLSPEVVEAFKAEGAGWQTRIDEALKEWLAKKVA